MTIYNGRLFDDNGGLRSALYAPSPQDQSINGWKVNQLGESYLINLVDDVVPTSAEIFDGLAISTDGALYVTSSAVDPANVDVFNGLSIRRDGALHISEPGTAKQRINGLAVTDSGQAIIGSLHRYGLLPGSAGDYFSTPSTLSAEMITNTVDRDFSGAGNWGLGAEVAVSGGVLQYTAMPASQLYPRLQDTFINPYPIVGQYYAVTYTVSGYSAGGVKVVLGDQSGTNRTANGTYQDILMSSVSMGNRLYLQAQGASTTLAIDNVSLKKLGVLDIYGDISTVEYFAMDDWTPAVRSQTLAKSNSGNNQRSYQSYVDTTGLPGLLVYSDGGVTLFNNVATAAPTIANGAGLYVLRTLDVNDGGGNRVAKFYTSTTSMTAGFTQLGTTVTTAGVATIFVGSATLEVGSINGGATQILAGKSYQNQLWNGLLTVDGSGNLVTSAATLVANFDARMAVRGATTFTDSTGKVWTKQGNSSFV